MSLSGLGFFHYALLREVNVFRSILHGRGKLSIGP